MLKMLRFVQYVWIGIAAICLVEFIRSFNQAGNSKWIFGGFMIVSIVMFFVRKRQVDSYLKRKEQRESQSEE